MTGFFHPLDGSASGTASTAAAGFLQYQFVVPDAEGETVRRVIERLTEVKLAAFLAVLKRFGPGDPGPLSFPMPGWTLALDLPVGQRRSWTGCSTTSTSWSWRPAGASTWPRTHGWPRTRSGPCTPGSTTSSRSSARSTPTACCGPTSDDGSASAPTPTRSPTEPDGPTGPSHPRTNHHGGRTTMIDATGRPQSVLVLGGASEIAQAIVAGLVPGTVPDGRPGRPSERAPRVGGRPRPRAAGADVVETVAFDTTDLAGHPAAVDAVFERFGDIDLVLAAAGALGDQSELETDPRGRGRPHHHQLHRAGRGAPGRGGQDARPGLRSHRRDLVGGRRAGPQGQLHLRLDQVRPRRLLPGPGRLAGRDRRRGHHRAARASWSAG